MLDELIYVTLKNLEAFFIQTVWTSVYKRLITKSVLLLCSHISLVIHWSKISQTEFKKGKCYQEKVLYFTKFMRKKDSL